MLLKAAATLSGEEGLPGQSIGWPEILNRPDKSLSDGAHMSYYCIR